MKHLWAIDDGRSALAGAFDEAAKPPEALGALVVFQRDGESEAELKARARAETAADPYGRPLIVVRFA